jgi:tRNA(Ile)-lysidine synthase
MNFGAAWLRAVLEEHLPAAATGLVVAVSGGADSACLLAALAQGGAPAPRGLKLRAVHVDHGLQPASAAFREASIALCRRWHMPLSVITVRVETGGGVSIEAAARDARYGGLARALAPGECPLTAHHSQDQAETLLLQLLRGAGVKGLSAMPMCRPLGSGWHVRPLLDVARRDLREFGETHGVAVADDPMNHDPRFDRSYLRSHVWPLIERRWPGAAGTLSRTARHLAETSELLDQSASRRVQRLRDGDALSVTGLRGLPPLEQINALRHWLFSAAVTPPPASRLTEALRQVFAADADHLPAIVWGSYALRRYRERLFITPATVPSLGARREWLGPRACAQLPGSSLDLGPGLGRLRWAPQLGGLDASRLPDTVSVRQRRGGETIKPGRRAKTQTVQHLCQRLGVLPWMRDVLPMVYADEWLIAIGDLWQDARFCVAADAPGVGCHWDDAPMIV